MAISSLVLVIKEQNQPEYIYFFLKSHRFCIRQQRIGSNWIVIGSLSEMSMNEVLKMQLITSPPRHFIYHLYWVVLMRTAFWGFNVEMSSFSWWKEKRQKESQYSLHLKLIARLPMFSLSDFQSEGSGNVQETQRKKLTQWRHTKKIVHTFSDFLLLLPLLLLLS